MNDPGRTSRTHKSAGSLWVNHWLASLARSNRSNRLSGVDRSSHSNRCHTDQRTPCIFPVSGPFLYSWESGEADSIAPLLSSRSGFLRSRYRGENVGIRSWLPCPSYLVRNCVEVGISGCHVVAGSRAGLPGLQSVHQYAV